MRLRLFSQFKVARGLAVTTEAYGRFAAQPAVAAAITKLVEALKNQKTIEEVQSVCAE